MSTMGNMKSISKLENLLGRAIPIICLLYLSFISLPFVLFHHNLSEFHSGYFNIIRIALIPLAVSVIAVTLILAALPRFFATRVTALLISLCVLVYIQCTFLVSNYGPLTGEPINWDSFAVTGVFEGALWVLVLLTSILLPDPILKARNVILSFVVLASTLGMVIVVFERELRLFTPPQKTVATEAFRFSMDRNILEVVLDSFSSPAFESVIDADPSLREALRGFTYYPNTITSFTTTAPSIPSILTSAQYDNTESMKRFLDRTFAENSVPALLDEHGVDVTVMSLPQLCSRIDQSCSSLGRAVSTDERKIARQELLELFDLSLFRAAPQPAKKLVYHDERWFFQRLFSQKGSPSSHYNSLRFVDVFERNTAANAVKPTFKFFHLMLPHAPFIFDSECEPTLRGKKLKSKKEPYEEQATCALRLFLRMVNVLKERNLFNNTMIIVHADHGYTVRYLSYTRAKELPILEQAMPLLLIKPFESNPQNELAVSQVPAQLIDIPKTIADALSINSRFAGDSIFRLTPDTPRTRRYRDYGWHNDFWGDAYLPKMQEWEVTGHVRDGESWRRGVRYLPPK